jgi:hypothetical protein
MPVRPDTVTVSFRVNFEVRDAIERACEKDRRYLSDWLRLAVEEQLIQRKFLKPRPRPIAANNQERT